MSLLKTNRRPKNSPKKRRRLRSRNLSRSRSSLKYSDCPRTPAPRRVPSSRIRAQRPRPVLVGAAKPEPPSSDALRPPSNSRSAGSDGAPAAAAKVRSSDATLAAPGPFAPPAPEGSSPAAERPCAPISGASGPSTRARSAPAHWRTRGLCSARDGTAPAYTTMPTATSESENVRSPPSKGGTDARRKARPA